MIIPKRYKLILNILMLLLIEDIVNQKWVNIKELLMIIIKL